MNQKIKRGYNIPLRGSVEEKIIESFGSDIYTVHPFRFRNIKAKLLVKEGDSVKIGSALFFDKNNNAAIFASPAAGKISEIKFGPRRRVDKITIESSGESVVQHKKFSKENIASQDPKELAEILSQAGMWPFIRQRPFDCIAKSDDTPSSIFINCMDTSPLAANPEFLYQDQVDSFELAVEAMKKLSNGSVHIVTDAKIKNSIFGRINGNGIQQHTFSGKHPAGLVGTHIEKIDPVTGPGKVVWYLNLESTVKIGTFLSSGKYPIEKKVAVVGESAPQNAVFNIRQGAAIKSWCKSIKDETRIISGNVLTGTKIKPDDSVGIYDNQLTLIPESTDEHFIGWMLPGFSKPSYSRAFASFLVPGRKPGHNTNLRGEPRALVKTGDYRKVVALDIYPAELVKAILSEDIEQMEQLGILEVTPEDVALCSYICPSKTEFTEIIQSGLDLMKAELG